MSSLSEKKCEPCTKKTKAYTFDQAKALMPKVKDWDLDENCETLILIKSLTVKNFMTAIEYFNKIAEIAEAEGHHPDLVLSGYRGVMISVWTHEVGGLTENDFILASKISKIPVELKKNV